MSEGGRGCLRVFKGPRAVMSGPSEGGGSDRRRPGNNDGGERSEGGPEGVSMWAVEMGAYVYLHIHTDVYTDRQTCVFICMYVCVYTSS